MPQANPAKFFGEVKAELLKVSWPGRKEVIRLTTVVIILSLIVGAFVGGLDFIFTKIISLIL
jgi:preprotein translocase subunit SecE